MFNFKKIGMLLTKAISVIVLSGTGWVCTSAYNGYFENQKLEADFRRDFKEILPHVISDNTKERKSAVYSLSLYGEKSIPILLHLISDGDDVVKTTAVDALRLTGKVAETQLANLINDSATSDETRGAALVAYISINPIIGRAKALNYYKQSNSAWLRRNALVALAYSKNSENKEFFEEILNDATNSGAILAGDVIYGYRFIASTSEQLTMAKKYINDPNSYVRNQVYEMLRNIPGSDSEKILTMASKSEKSTDLKKTLAFVIDSQKQIR